MRGGVVDLSFDHIKEDLVIGSAESLESFFAHKVI